MEQPFHRIEEQILQTFDQHSKIFLLESIYMTLTKKDVVWEYKARHKEMLQGICKRSEVQVKIQRSYYFLLGLPELLDFNRTEHWYVPQSIEV